MGKHVLFGRGIRRLGSKEEGFSYRYPGTDVPVREERVLTRIEDLKVPPDWKRARIARSPSAKAHAVGYDPAGRLRYRYHDNHRELPRQPPRAQGAGEVRTGPGPRGQASRGAALHEQPSGAQAPGAREGFCAFRAKWPKWGIHTQPTL